MPVIHAMQTPDGVWRVETVEEDGRASMTLIWRGLPIQWLTPASVQEILERAGVDMADLVEVPPDN